MPRDTYPHATMMALTAGEASSKARPFAIFPSQRRSSLPLISLFSGLTKSRVTRDFARGEFPKESVIDDPFLLNLLPSSYPCDLNQSYELNLHWHTDVF